MKKEFSGYLSAYSPATKDNVPYVKLSVKAIESVKWIPEWGEDRIKGMVRDRSDWCISRQRT